MDLMLNEYGYDTSSIEAKTYLGDILQIEAEQPLRIGFEEPVTGLQAAVAAHRPARVNCAHVDGRIEGLIGLVGLLEPASLGGSHRRQTDQAQAQLLPRRTRDRHLLQQIQREHRWNENASVQRC